MKKLLKIMLPVTMCMLLIAGVCFAKEVRENKSFREETKTIKTLSVGEKTKTITRNYRHGRDIPDAIPYREYVSNSWWSGSLSRIETKYDHSNEWWIVTFTGKLKEVEGYRTVALDEKGKEFGEIIDTGSFMPVEKEAEKRSDKSKRREVRIRLTKVKKAPANYYYEEYDDKKECYYGGELKLSRTYEEEGKTIACYRGYLEEKN